MVIIADDGSTDEAIVFHMHHPRDPTAPLRLNRAYARRRNVPARCVNGIVKLQEDKQADENRNRRQLGGRSTENGSG